MWWIVVPWIVWLIISSLVLANQVGVLPSQLLLPLWVVVSAFRPEVFSLLSFFWSLFQSSYIHRGYRILSSSSTLASSLSSPLASLFALVAWLSSSLLFASSSQQFPCPFTWLQQALQLQPVFVLFLSPLSA